MPSVKQTATQSKGYSVKFADEFFKRSRNIVQNTFKRKFSKQNNTILFYLYIISNFPKTFIANAVYQKKIFGSAEFAVFFSVFDDSLRDFRADVRQLFQFLNRSAVDVNRRFGNCYLTLSRRNLFCIF